SGSRRRKRSIGDPLQRGGEGRDLSRSPAAAEAGTHQGSGDGDATTMSSVRCRNCDFTSPSRFRQNRMENNAVRAMTGRTGEAASGEAGGIQRRREGQPPFRAEQIGSLLRPRPLTQAYRLRNAGALGEAEYREIQDRAIRNAVLMQEQLGFAVV